jgi:hypothetical protein
MSHLALRATPASATQHHDRLVDEEDGDDADD